MDTTYTWQPVPETRTRMTLRNWGEPVGFRKIAAPVMAAAMTRANSKDLDALKRFLEATESDVAPGVIPGRKAAMVDLTGYRP